MTPTRRSLSARTCRTLLVGVAALVLVLLSTPLASAQQGSSAVGYVSHLATGAGTSAVAAARNRVYLLAPARTTTDPITDPRVLTDLRVIDVSDPSSPRELGSLPVTGGIRVAIQGDVAYVLAAPGFYNNGRVVVVDVADPAAMRQVGAVSLSTRFPGDAVVSGRYLYAVSGLPIFTSRKTIDVVDVADPTRPTVVGSAGLSADVGGQLSSVAVANGYAYVADTTAGLRVINVSDPTRPAQVGLYQPPAGSAAAIVVQGNRAYLGTGPTSGESAPGGLRVLDVSDPTRPTELASLSLPRQPSEVRAAASTLYLADGRGGVRVVDVSDASRPREVASTTAAEDAGSVAIDGTNLYVGDADGALWVLRYPDAAPSLPPRSYLPLVAQAGALPGTGGAFATSIAVQNAGTATANVSIQVLKTDGTAAATAIQTQVAAGASQLVYLPAVQTLGPGRYTAVISSDQPVRAQANLLAQAPARAGSYSGVRPTGAGRSVQLPGLFKGYVGYTSAITVQNPSPGDARVTITYRDQSGDTLATGGPFTVPRNGVVDAPLAATSLPEGFVGGAVVSSDLPILATAQVVNTAGELGIVAGVAAYPTHPIAAYRSANLPVVYKNYSSDGWVSSILVQNLGGDTAAVKITFRGAALPSPVVLTDTMAPGAAKQYYQGTQPDLPDGFVGSAVVEQTSGSGGIVAVSNVRNAAGNLGSYAASMSGESSTGATRVVLFPALYSDYSTLHWTSSFAVQNTANFTTNVEITYLDQSGPVKTTTESLGPGEARLLYQPADGLPAGFHGSALVTSGGQIAGIANVLAVDQTGGDWLMVYEGLNTLR